MKIIEVIPGKKYRLFWETGTGADGKRRQKSETFSGGKKAATKRWRDVQAEVELAGPEYGRKHTLEEVVNRYLDDVLPTKGAKPTSIQSLRGIARAHVIPDVGKVDVTKWQASDLQRYLRQKLQQKKKKGNGTLSPAYVHQIHGLIHAALEQAVRWGVIPRNIAGLVDPPPLVRDDPAAKAWGEADALRFLGATEGSRLHALYLAAIATGMRQGELLGLRWQDIDLAAGSITTKQTLARVDGQVIYQSPKTRGSRRAVIIPERVISVLESHRARILREKAALGEDYQDNGLVFPKADGAPMNQPTLRRHFRSDQERAGVPVIRWHDLRHTSATLLFAKGVHPKVVSERLGHSRIGITLDTYSHVLPAMQEEAARAMGDILGSGTDSGTCGDGEGQQTRS